MHLTRRMRLIWHKLWLIPLVGATADVVAGEAAKLGGVTVPIPWLFSAIGVAGMLLGAVARAYSVPLIPEGLEVPDEGLTRRSRILGERLGATPVRVFVSDLPKLRGKVDTFIDGHDLFVSERVAGLPEAERDFALARALVPRGAFEIFERRRIRIFLTLSGTFPALYMDLERINWFVRSPDRSLPMLLVYLFWFTLIPFSMYVLGKSCFGDDDGRTRNAIALRSVGNLPASISALRALANTCAEMKRAALEAGALEKWWNAAGQKAVEASEWYQRERSLAATGETGRIPLTE